MQHLLWTPLCLFLCFTFSGKLVLTHLAWPSVYFQKSFCIPDEGKSFSVPVTLSPVVPGWRLA